jgi:hypothetical protein
MKYFFLCGKCLELENERKDEKDQGKEDIFHFTNLNNDGIYFIKCKVGHETYYVDQSLRFQNLFHSGCYALLDGYHRESISSFAASLERFYETIIKVLISKSSVDAKAQESAWKTIKRQSERQLGAFVYLFLREYSKMPRLLTDADVKVRNDVVHMGHIPTYEEAIAFGEAVVNIQRLNLLDVLEKDKGQWIIEFGKEIVEKQKKVPEGNFGYAVNSPFMVMNPFFHDTLTKEINLGAKLNEFKIIKGYLDGIPYRLGQFLM